jgi:hypothetical protein
VADADRHTLSGLRCRAEEKPQGVALAAWSRGAYAEGGEGGGGDAERDELDDDTGHSGDVLKQQSRDDGDRADAAAPASVPKTDTIARIANKGR